MLVLLFLTLSFYLTNYGAIACNKYNISHMIQNDTVEINFLTNNILKLDRKIRCKANSSSEIVNGCTHYCTQLGYGEYDIISLDMYYDNGTNDSCSIEYRTELQKPSLAYLNISNNKIHLGINPPLGSFDYVSIQCPTNESYKIFNTSISSDNSLTSIDCSFSFNTSLMTFILTTVKQDFPSAINQISQEIPLPIPFQYSLDSRLLTVIADAAPPMNLYSTYDFQLIFYDNNVAYERMTVTNLNPNLGYTVNIGVLPNVEHEIIFKHIVNSIGFVQSNITIPPISNISYPFEVKNLTVKEEFDNIIVDWADVHDLSDPIEYIVLCNSSQDSMRNVGRNTTYICRNMLFNQTNTISVQTRIAIPGYTNGRTVTVEINVEQIPDIPDLEVFTSTENSITIRWNYDNNSLINNSFQYKISCGVGQQVIPIDIHTNEYQCQSLIHGTLYVIKMIVENLDNTTQRSKSINGNTLLQKCQYITHFYSPDINGTRSVIIEWNPPENNFDKIYVYCPSSYIIFEYSQIMSNMFVKCIVTSGIPYNVTFATFKSGYESAILLFTDASPNDFTTTISATTTISTSVPTTIPTITVPTTVATITATISTSVTTTVPTITAPTSRTTTLATTVTGSSPVIVTSDATGSLLPPVTNSDTLVETQDALTKWRTAAIVAFIVAGFLFLSTLCLTICSIILCLRN